MAIPDPPHMNPPHMDPNAVFRAFYPDDTPLRRKLLNHSSQVRDEALRIAATPACAGMPLDLDLVSAGAWLHDIGVCRCNAPDIFCTGTQPYIRHGIIGADMLREFGALHGLDLEPCARICERHTGSGLTAVEISIRRIPLPVRDYLPETLEEKLVCLADKFYSKSGDGHRKGIDAVRRSQFRFGDAALRRLDALLALFGLA